VKRFRFSLASVLDLKRQVEERCQRGLAAAQAQRDRTLQWLASAEHSLRDLGQAQSRVRGATIDLNAEAWYQARQKGLLSSIRHLNADLARHEAELDAARAKAVEAARERRVLEKLEETQRNAWLQALNTEEQGMMDELAQRARNAFSPNNPSASPV
jgi:flagellar export protein FliJ